MLEETGYPYKRWAATSAAGATLEQFNEFTRHGLQEQHIRQGEQKVDGVGAIYLSHVRLLKHIAEKEEGVYMIIEDDLYPLKKQRKWVDEVMCHIGKLPEDWHMYKFAYINTMVHTL
eukprot:gnl/MRDRNA2_/MRDRNA2_117885_c0_seq1.p1 gnl/MRDRNA2_/MRDRNA2_117885_c0~~gnl/MRDRNA2_/MRDRNA2_117885_c0_seq1.p1  ORF type:complete len:117 (-),score=20.50 gnl/MRDRNA2_/MRDRNA2_117885_c0_seq1:284-634(-)